MTHLEALDEMIEEGNTGIANMQKQIVKQEIMDRLGKRLILRDSSYQLKLGKIQEQLNGMKHALTELEGAQKMLLELRDDMVAESAG